MRRPDAQRAEPQPPQPLIRKRALEPERSRLLAARCGARRESRPAPPQAAEARTRARTPTPHRATARRRPRPAAARRRARRAAGTPRTRSPARPAPPPRPPPAARPPTSARRCGNGNRSSPSGSTGPQEIGERRERERRLGARRTAREDREPLLPRVRHRRLEQRRLPDPRLTVQHERLGRVAPGRQKAPPAPRPRASRPTTPPRSRAPRASPDATAAGNRGTCQIRIVARRRS